MVTATFSCILTQSITNQLQTEKGQECG